jgi:hypothetical protein
MLPALALPPWFAVEPPELPLLRADDPWPQPIEEISSTRPAPANSQDAVFDDSLIMLLPFAASLLPRTHHLCDCEIRTP